MRPVGPPSHNPNGKPYQSVLDPANPPFTVSNGWLRLPQLRLVWAGRCLIRSYPPSGGRSTGVFLHIEQSPHRHWRAETEAETDIAMGVHLVDNSLDPRPKGSHSTGELQQPLLGCPKGLQKLRIRLRAQAATRSNEKSADPSCASTSPTL